MTGKNLFFLGLILAAGGVFSPPLALVAGIAYGMAVRHPYHLDAQRLSRLLLQASVVALGFGIPLAEVIRVGRSGALYTAGSIAFAVAMGLLLGRALRVRAGSSYLITIGTAVCGGSAIAAVAPISRASDEDMAVSLGTVFLLNSVALVLFPLVGHAAGLTQEQFGLWAALAIHDTSSVVGAAARYGAVALAVGTTVKLARALWIVPVSVATAVTTKSKTRIRWPWFIGLFCLAALANTLLPRFHGAFLELNRLGRVGLTVTLFLIGTGITRKTLREVGVRPMVQGLALWLVVATGSLALIRAGVLGL
ncbi:MAG: putative sulfate exporter family transporter [Acidobacteria bacterium]|nr:putative sulfate exporter family transporter [Acidobacteriota bacterium]